MFIYLKSKIRKDKNRGFTLIELVVSISIIVTLTSMVLPAIANVRRQARDTARAQTMRELQSSLDDYFDDNGSYPSTGGAYCGSEPGGTYDCGADWISGLAPKYIRALPKDPLGKTNTKFWSFCSTYDGEYLYQSNGSTYVLLSHCAVESASNLNNISNLFYDPVRPTYAWKICGGLLASTCMTAW